jgi:hypothetical protein
MEADAEAVVLADREHRYTPPPWRMFVALTDEIDQWLRRLRGEMPPRVLASEKPRHLTWSSLWPVSAHDRIDFYIRADGDGAAVRFVWSSPQPPGDRGIGLVRLHLNRAFAGDLRWWVDSHVPKGA